MTRSGKGNDTAGRDEENNSHPPAAANDKSLPQTPRSESLQSEPTHEEPPTTTTEALKKEEERRRKIVEALQKGKPYKDLARRYLDNKGRCSEQEVNSLLKDVYGIDYNNPSFIFEDKMAERMVDANKWKRTDVAHIVDGRAYSYQPEKPQKIQRRSYNIENSDQATTPNPWKRDKQVISRPSKEKYGYLPQFHELSSSMPGIFGNSDYVEGFLVGGKEKLQEIRRELGSNYGARSPGESQEKDNDGSVLSGSHSPVRQTKKKFTLWGVDLYEEDIQDCPDVDSSKGKSGSTDEQEVKRSI